ncbi:hypothetical protein GSI_05775 [Ganoderma sinense ZZ0214-1]|uniref:Uncharacterized protein n=1 Tax=Ganoderma sinense ZZ0214-1 TaxID=1077348 RepID=A0A2G8SBE3_9APHY|nr:hypothetical protein GSI_05775 [Ganoderma sinense ZZ0214-1]
MGTYSGAGALRTSLDTANTRAACFVASCSSTIFYKNIVGIVLAIATAELLNDCIYEPESQPFFTLSMLIGGSLSYMGWAIGNDHIMPWPWIGAVACLPFVLFFSR